jgi:hypothetical protein
VTKNGRFLKSAGRGVGARVKIAVFSLVPFSQECGWRNGCTSENGHFWHEQKKYVDESCLFFTNMKFFFPRKLVKKRKMREKKPFFSNIFTFFHAFFENE